MTNWAQYRPDKAKFTPANIDPTLCTHLIYAFAAINTTSFEIKSFEWNDESTEELVGKWTRINDSES
jgi:chitinase